MQAKPQALKKYSISNIRRILDRKRWLVIIDEIGQERAYIPFKDRTKYEYIRCIDDAKKIAAVLTDRDK